MTLLLDLVARYFSGARKKTREKKRNTERKKDLLDLYHEDIESFRPYLLCMS